MATCGSLQHIFEEKKKPIIPETPIFLDSLSSSSWNQNNINNSSPIDNHSFTEIFGELHFKEDSSSSSPSSLFACLQTDKAKEMFGSQSDYNNNFPPKQFIMSSSESLQLCTEGLGFESSDDVEEMKSDIDLWTNQEEKGKETHSSSSSTQQGKVCMREYRRRSRLVGTGEGFPPPITSIGKSGKPGVCFRSFRSDGRFVLKEIRIPTQEFLHARREDGRLRLQIIQSEDDHEGDMEEEEDHHEEEIDEEDDEIENNINDEEKKVDFF
ncbi:protein FAF-like, chloroplastic [Impatiens glandulifera]|uniref:protein FAF-like, chloroplastic n=1 Tax=Impatiens glandulifera TaxID=253017 RepID=UPI001FB06DFF|nr:protein FAF-like, chloroplastic [Impatiens glandulifera]